jgi:hypothetical protein
LFALSINVFQVQLVINILADNPNPKGVVHGLIEEVAEELDDIGVMLSLEQLHCFLLVVS